MNTNDLACDAYVIAAISLFATDHQLAATVCLVMICLHLLLDK